jgi:hypothetical protein
VRAGWGALFRWALARGAGGQDTVLMDEGARGSRSWGRGAWLGVVVLAAAGWLSSAPAQADAMRCGRQLVPDDSTLTEVVQTCGAPTTRTHRVEHHTYSVVGRDGTVTTGSREVLVDELSYDFGPTQFVYHLSFENERMVRMSKGDYGKPR